MTRNAQLAGRVLACLSGLGIEKFVVCAGARNAPLVTSLLSAQQNQKLTIHHGFDERAASFFALGLAKKDPNPIAIVTTSGTAVAELIPAAVEAFYSGIPLVFVTADRPSSYRGSGAPQAIEQAGIFGPYAPLHLDWEGDFEVGALATWNRHEPLHLNVCLEEPQPEDTINHWEKESFSLPDKRVISADQILSFLKGGQTLVLLGELPAAWQSPVESLLENRGVAIWAEATSGLRESARLRAQLLASDRCIPSLRFDQVLRIGGVPSLRFWRDLETSEDLEVLSVAPRPFSGLARQSDLLTGDCIVESGESTECEETQPCWVSDLTLLGPEELLKKHPQSEPGVFQRLSEQVPSEALVYLGNSLPIREWNLAASREIPHPRTFASRGANGIDGQLATFLGMADGEDEAWGIFGDLTALYDLNAPALLAQITTRRLRLVIINNGGGRIFSRLPSMASLSAEEKKVTENHHQTRFQSWAEMWGMDYVAWHPENAFPELSDSATVVEVIVNQETSEAFWKDWS